MRFVLPFLSLFLSPFLFFGLGGEELFIPLRLLGRGSGNRLILLDQHPLPRLSLLSGDDDDLRSSFLGLGGKNFSYLCVSLGGEAGIGSFSSINAPCPA